MQLIINTTVLTHVSTEDLVRSCANFFLESILTTDSADDDFEKKNDYVSKRLSGSTLSTSKVLIPKKGDHF